MSKPQEFSADEVQAHCQDGLFWAVLDGFVVDASDLIEHHPGGIKKILSANAPHAGATGQASGFSFSRGRNAHFPRTAQRFRDGVQRYLTGKSTKQTFLPPVEVAFEPYGKLVILGRISN